MNYKDIEKVHPLIIFLIFILAITAIFPVTFQAPVSSQTSPFSNDIASGSITFALSNNNTIFIDITIYSIQNYNLYSSSQINGHTIVNNIDIYDFSFNVYKKPTNNEPLKYAAPLNLSSSDLFVANFNIYLYLSFGSSQPFYISFFQIGRSDRSLDNRWSFITSLSCIAILIVSIYYFTKKFNIALLSMLKSFFKYSFTNYESSLSSLNENLLFILFFTPSILLFTFFSSVYINFSYLTKSTPLFYNLKADVLVLLATHIALIVFSPVILNYILDRYYGNPLIKKTRIKNSLIFLLFYIPFYGFIALLVELFPFDQFFILLLPIAFIFNVGLYFISAKHHCWKYNYHLSDIKILRTSILFRLLYSLTLFFSLELFVFSNSPLPVYYLLI